MSEEEVLHCPYNFSHVILKSRMASHLIKCRQQFPLQNHTTCPFNATHDVPTPELKYHVDTCPDRKTMENFLYVVDDQESKEDTPTEVQLPHMEENWDEERVPGSYLETKDRILEEKMFFQPRAGKSKSERKMFVLNQLQKFAPTQSDAKNVATTSRFSMNVNDVESEDLKGEGGRSKKWS